MVFGKFKKMMSGGGDKKPAPKAAAPEEEAPKPKIVQPGQAVVGHQPPPERPNANELVAEVRDGLSRIPPLPQVVIQILQELNNPDSNAKTVARVAQSDPSLAAAMIRVVNSAMYGVRNPITSVDQAVTLLGFSTIRSLVMRLKLDEAFNPPASTGIYDSEDLWVHSMAVADVADILARRIPNVDRGFVSTFGLVHDIGKMAINSKVPQPVIDRWHNEPSTAYETFIMRERRIFGNDHAGLGEFLASRWDLPDELCEAIGLHHSLHTVPSLPSLAESQKRALYLVHIANQLTKYAYIYCEDMEIDPITQDMFDLLGLEPSLDELMDMRICSAVSRAIFFAEERSKRDLGSIRKTMPLRTGSVAQAAAEASAVTASAEYRILINGPACQRVEELLGDYLEDDDDFCPEFSKISGDGSYPEPEEMALYSSSKFNAKADKASLQWLMDGALAHQKAMRVRAEAYLPARFVTRRILANLDGYEGIDEMSVDVIQTIRADRLHVVVRCEALSFAHRLGENANEHMKRGLVLADLGHLLNLGWFESIEASEGGDVLIFVSTPLK